MLDVSVSKTTQRPLRVLAVEDDESVRMLYEAVLEEAGHEVRVAANGRDALAMLDWEPDLILVDLMLPIMDGYEFLRRLRSMPEGAHVPVVVLSAALPPGRHSVRGAEAVLRKPFDLGVLMHTITRVAADHGLRPNGA